MILMYEMRVFAFVIICVNKLDFCKSDLVIQIGASNFELWTWSFSFKFGACLFHLIHMDFVIQT